MSRIVRETQTFHPSGLEVLDANGGSVTVSNVNNFIGENGSTSTDNRAQYNLVPGASAETFGWASMDCSSLPRNITINNVTGKFKIYHSGSATYISPRQIRPYYNNRQTAKGFSVNLAASTTVTDLDMGTSWTRNMFDDLEFRIYSKRTNRNVTSNYYVRPYGIDVTVEYEYTMYEFTCNSSLTGIGMSPSSGEAMSGDSYTVTITGITDISTVIIKDNGVDITSLFARSGSNYTYTLNNINADHTIVVEDNSSSSSKKSYVKKNNEFVETTNQYVKESNSWINRTISKIFWKINGSWTETNDSMSGKTAFKID